jgi:hypothetical protein
MNLLELPNELLVVIINKLRDRDKCQFMASCRTVHNLHPMIFFNQLISMDDIPANKYNSFVNVHVPYTVHVTPTITYPAFVRSITTNYIVSHAPNTLTHIVYANDFDGRIDTPIPNSARSLTFSGCPINHPISADMMASLEELYFFTSYNFCLTDMLPRKLKVLTLTLNENYNQILHPNDIPKSVTHLTLRKDFNQSLQGILPDALVDLNLYCKFNQDILPGHLPSSLRNLSLGYKFNKPIIGCIPYGLVHLELDGFNHNVDDLPASIIHLTFGDNFDHPVNKLPPFLLELKLGYYFTECINELPSTLTHLTLSCEYSHNIDALPNSLVYLNLSGRFNRVITIFPPRLKHLTFGTHYNQVLPTLPCTLKYLKLGRDFNQSIADISSAGLEYLEFGSAFNQPIKDTFPLKGYHGIKCYIPRTVTNLKFSCRFNQDISDDAIPSSVTHLTFGWDFGLGANSLEIFRREVVNNIPQGVTHLEFEGRISYSSQKLFPQTIYSLIVQGYETRSKSKDNPWNDPLMI